MSYTPIVPASGYAGWKILSRTLDTQKTAFANSADVKRDEEYFREKIGSVTSAEELVSDRRLLKVALGAFGLENDINNKFFIRKVLEEGTLDSKSFANKLADKTYLRLSEAFGFGDYTTPLSQQEGFADTILAQYESRSFEAAVGDSDENMRLALSMQRELPELAAKSTSNDAKWYTVIGNKALSTVMRSALALPSSVGALDVDRQLEIYKDKAERVFGSSDFSTFSDPDQVEKAVRLFLVRSQLNEGSSMNSQSVALTLLQSGQSNLFRRV
ncbi:DUF1217 domain-containing protein [Rhodobacter lacus]|uniref:DUF1217 domain-containing protein n=1 Tax=Rhodobacter lacus TaxID=1641972 RepID=A0ABW5A5Y1_9RHOB